jgi:hypothetical protein
MSHHEEDAMYRMNRVVQLRLSDAEREIWVEAAGRESLSGFVRRAVGNEIALAPLPDVASRAGRPRLHASNADRQRAYRARIRRRDRA